MRINYIFFILVILIIAVSGCEQAIDEAMSEDSMMEKESMQKDDAAMQKDEAMMEKDDSAMMEDSSMMEKDSMMGYSYSGKVLAGTTSKYLEFSKADYDNALSENKKILLYFYASWCPICKKEQPETFAAFNELNDSNIVGFRVSYNDNEDADEKALAKQFGIAYQHTKVILKDGKQAAKFPDSWNRQRYLDEFAKV